LVLESGLNCNDGFPSEEAASTIAMQLIVRNTFMQPGPRFAYLSRRNRIVASR
jgi:hypothetical protein